MSDRPLRGQQSGCFRRSRGAVGIELKEIEALHVQPLVHKAGDELIGTWISDQAIDLLRAGFR